MKNLLLKFVFFYLLLGLPLFVDAQDYDKPIYAIVETTESKDYKADEKSEKLVVSKHQSKSFYRHHKKLPATFDGYVIELTTSDFPLNRDYHLFEQFGEVYYDKVENKGYSYLLVINFSSKKPIEDYVKKVLIYRAPEARVIEYKKGKRIIK